MAATATMAMLLQRSDFGFGGHVAATDTLLRSKRIATTSAQGSLLEALPIELLLEVFKNLDLASIFALSATCKGLLKLYMDHKTNMVVEALTLDPEFSPVGALFRLAAMAPSDLKTPWGAWLAKPIIFKTRVLFQGRMLPLRAANTEDMGLEEFHTVATTPSKYIEEADIDRLLRICRLVKGWERIFPHYRFAQHPEQMRTLLPHEARRLRGALYHWMTYHYYFHSDLPRPSHRLPRSSDMRCNMIRTLDSGEATELEDLWMTVKSAVGSLCPSAEAVRLGVESVMSEEHVAKIAWSANEEEHYIVMSTMLKLGPEKLLYYIDHRHEYSKERLIREIRRERPRIESDIESLTSAISMVYLERHTDYLRFGIPAPPRPLLPRRPYGGILDSADEAEERGRGKIEAGYGLRLLPYEDEDEEDGLETSRGALMF